MMDMAAVEIKGLCKRFGSRELFRDLSMSIGRGEFAAVSGSSGCGKTTLMNIIGGLEPYDSGRVIVEGTDVGSRRNRARFYSDTVGFLFQNYVLIEDRTVRENLELIKKAHRSGIGIDEALELVGLGSAVDSKVYTLSGGEQQRVALARLMIKKCSLVLADEPTGSLDRGNADNVMRLLSMLRQQGKTIMLVSHDPEAVKWSDRVIYLGDR